jgi:DNA-binding transcriptional LysR family regulator
MELRRVRYFVAVAEELHFRRAAERLHLAQPALSQQIQKLEEELGAALLHRTSRGAELTRVGAQFLPEARRLLRQADDAVRTARDAKSGRVGRLRFAHTADGCPSQLPRIISAFARRHPAIELAPECLPARRALEDVRSGRIDVAVVALPANTAGLAVTPITAERLVAAVPDYDALSGTESISIAALGAHPLIVLPRAVNPPIHDAITSACHECGVAVTSRESSEPLIEHALFLVLGGAGLAVLTASAASRHPTLGVSFKPLHPSPVIQMAIVSRPEPDDMAVAAFIKVARDLDLPAKQLAAVLASATAQATA